MQVRKPKNAEASQILATREVLLLPNLKDPWEGKKCDQCCRRAKRACKLSCRELLLYRDIDTTGEASLRHGRGKEED